MKHTLAFVLFAFAALPAHAQMRLAQAPPPAPPPPLSARAIEDETWDSVKDTRSTVLIQTYLDHYPAGVYSADAQSRIATLKAPGACVSSHSPPAQNETACEVENAMMSAFAWQAQASQMVATAHLAQQQAEDAAKKAEVGVAGYKSEPVYYSATNRVVVGKYKGQVATGTDTPQGYGVGNWDSNSSYEGQWKDGQPDGAGVDTYPPFEIVKAGVWREKSLVLGVITNGTTVIKLERAGQFDTTWSNALNGYAVEREADGTTKVGNWHYGVLNGYGAKLDAKGNIVEQGLYFHDALWTTPAAGSH